MAGHGVRQWAGWLVGLSLLPRLTCGQGFVDCDPEPVLTAPVLHPSCCVETTVDSDTIKVAFVTTRPGENVWQLDVNFTWARPVGNNFNAYASTLDYTERITTTLYCARQYRTFVISEKEWVYFTDVRFGFHPFFILYTANTTAMVNNKKPTFKRVDFLDCFESTKSIDFCRTQDVQYASKPLDLQEESLVAEEQRDGEPLRATLTVSWSPPLQVNPTMALRSFSAVLVTDSRRTTSVTVAESQRNYTDPFGLSFTQVFEGVDVDEAIATNATVEVSANVLGMSCIGTCQPQSGSASSLAVDFSPLASLDARPTAPPPSAPTPDPAQPMTPALPISRDWLFYTVGGAVVLILLLVVLLTVYRRFWRPRPVEPPMQLKRSQAQSNPAVDGSSQSEVLVEPKPCFVTKELDRSRLHGVGPSNRIGRGSFGVVYRSHALGELNGKLDYYEVAVKGLKANASAADKETFLDEIALMIEIGQHPNILSVLGCCTVDEPYYLVTEYMRHGDLLHFLWKTREAKMAMEDSIYDLKEINQLQIAWQVARGMEYISKTRYYHGDLAARNVLVGDNLIVKVADFGLADDIYERGYKKASGKARPVKWASLETNTMGRYSVESDVWSFGILLFEIVTRGEVPYQGIKDNKELIDKLKAGYRMEQPEGCPDLWYDIMQRCWRASPASRPTFTQLYKALDKMLTRRSTYLVLDDLDEDDDTEADLRDAGEAEKTFGTATDAGSSELSGESDTLQLWLHLKGPLPDDVRTLDFVPMAASGEGSGQSGTSLDHSGVRRNEYERDRDCDILTK